MGDVFVNTIGLAVEIECGITLTGATGIILKVKKPDGKWYDWSGATVYQTTKLRYLTQSGDLDQVGHYQVYPHLTLGGFTGDGTPDRFPVKDPKKPDKQYNR
jgi:hypothetical protein